jgi:hypothetical protein
MARIQRTISGTSYQNPEYTAQQDRLADQLDDGRDMDTADRLREGRERFASRETRETEMDARNQPRSEVTDYVWRRPGSLDAPPPRPGMAQRWVRAETRSENDNLNWQSKYREGWRPRDPSTVPDCEALYNTSNHLGTAAIRVGGLILMEMPVERVQAKKRAIRDIITKQEQSVAMETAKISHEGQRAGFAPIVREEKAEVSTGRRPPTLTD